MRTPTSSTFSGILVHAWGLDGEMLFTAYQQRGRGVV
jgi:hypothetical protein